MVCAMTDPGRAALTRRAALAALAGVPVALAAGCDTAASPSGQATASPSVDPSPTSSVTASPSTGSTAEADPAADAAVVAAFLGSTEAARAQVVAARRAYRGLRARLLPLLEVHDEQARVLALLTDQTPPLLPPAAAPPTPARALADIKKSETALGADLTEAALGAGSGDLARVLASMAGGIAQALAALAATQEVPA